MGRRKLYYFLILLTIPIALLIIANAFFHINISQPTPYFLHFSGGVDYISSRGIMPPKMLQPPGKNNKQKPQSDKEKVSVTSQSSDDIGEAPQHSSDKKKVNMFDDETVNRLLAKLKALDSVKFGDFDIKKLEVKAKERRKIKSIKRDTLMLFPHENSPDLPNWKKFQKGIKRYEMYDGEASYVDGLLRDMSFQPIVDIETKEGGTELKLTIRFADGGKALFKPMRFAREVGTFPNHFVFNDFERHYAEIAAFHLDRILGFNAVPPVAGRRINMTHDIRRLVNKKIQKTFFVSPESGNCVSAGNICFYSKCVYYCDSSHAICGNPDMLEGSFATFLPKHGARKVWKNPWKRAYSRSKKAYWEVYDDLCDRVRVIPPYNSGRRLLDLMDLHIFDFITGNWDRHHYGTFWRFGDDTSTIRFDNGRGFGKANQDDLTVLAPIHQCCLIRYSTFIKLVSFYLGPEHLSDRMHDSLGKDSVSPVLAEPFYPAMDRRVMKILKEIADCILSGKAHTDVIVDDSF